MESCIDLLHHSGSPTWALSSSVSQEALSPSSSPELLNSSTTDMLGWIILYHAVFLWIVGNLAMSLALSTRYQQHPPPHLWQLIVSPDIAQRHLGSKITLYEDHWSSQLKPSQFWWVSSCFSTGQQAHSSHQSPSTQSSVTKILACLKTPVKQMSQSFIAIQVCSSPLKFKLL